MRHLELHIIQSVPVACLNRDDFGSPKTAVFGNVPRARVSSQSWKRAIRMLLVEESPQRFAGCRTKHIIEPLRDSLIQHGLSRVEAQQGAKDIAKSFGKLDKSSKQVKTLIFSSPHELDMAATAYAEKKKTKNAMNALGKTLPGDAADIALFGRMVASDHTLTLEGAAMFSHALSTHRVSNEIDFFSAVDDLKQEDAEEGVGMMGTLEFNSATYYRFAALNLDLLEDEAHLGGLTRGARQDVVRMFIHATLTAMPSARKNSMHAATLPSFVLAVVREKGHPVQLVNAFDEPVSAKGGLAEASRAKLEAEYDSLKKSWGLEAVAECRIPGMTLTEMLDEVARHVR